MTDALTPNDEPPPFALYSLGQIRWTAFLGGPLAATMMMSQNFRRLGQIQRAKWTWLIGAGALGVFIALSILAEQYLGKAGAFSLGLPLAIVAAQVAQRTQGVALEAHWSQGGRRQPFWKALLVFLGSLLLVMLGSVQVGVLLTKTVTIDGGHQVDIEGYATEADAGRAGSVLTEMGVLDAAHPVSFTLGRNKRGWLVTLAVDGDRAKDERTIAAFEGVARTLWERAFRSEPGAVSLVNQLAFPQVRLQVDAEGHLSRH